MTTLVDIVTSIIGQAPIGWEFVPYIVAAFCFFGGLMLVWAVVSIPLRFLRRR